MAEDPYKDPITGVLHNKLGLGTAVELETAERDIAHAALILLGETPVPASYDSPHLRAIHKRIFGDIYEWAGQRAFFGQLARDAGYTLAWRHLDAARNVAASAATMRGNPEPMREMLDTLVRKRT